MQLSFGLGCQGFGDNSRIPRSSHRPGQSAGCLPPSTDRADGRTPVYARNGGRRDTNSYFTSVGRCLQQRRQQAHVRATKGTTHPLGNFANQLFATRMPAVGILPAPIDRHNFEPASINKGRNFEAIRGDEFTSNRAGLPTHAHYDAGWIIPLGDGKPMGSPHTALTAAVCHIWRGYGRPILSDVALSTAASPPSGRATWAKDRGVSKKGQGATSKEEEGTTIHDV
mmetsp:Transcript_8654/g.12653  ORF Transcript_8654/g.12653 Transcript_8654/m.12653 type:complete len:226 (-) Transcript_8654:183-860(-)